jgi:hypothetical protein
MFTVKLISQRIFFKKIGTLPVCSFAISHATSVSRLEDRTNEFGAEVLGSIHSATCHG